MPKKIDLPEGFYEVKNKKLTVAMIHTQPPGIIMYRFVNFAKYMKGVKPIVPKWKAKDPENRFTAWEHFILQQDTKVMRDLEALVRKSDMIIFQRFVNDAGLAVIKTIKTLSGGTKKVGMEIDDYMYDVPSYNYASKGFTPDSPMWKVGKAQMQMSDFMVVSTNNLKEYYKDDNPNIFVLPNHMDFEWWGEGEKKKNEKIRIGWAGANAHSGDVAILTNVITEITAKYKNVEFYFYAPILPFESKEGLVVERAYSSLDKYPKKMRELGFDIGVAPLADHLFNRAKSANKWLEFSMLGIPTVASDIGGQFNEVIKHGVDGFLAQTEDDWIKYLSELIENETLRKQMGKLSFEKVNSEYRAEIGAKKYETMLKTAFKLRGDNELLTTGSGRSKVIEAGSGN